MNPFNFPLHPKDITILYLSSLPPASPLSPFPSWKKMAVPLLTQGSALSLSSESPTLPLRL